MSKLITPGKCSDSEKRINILIHFPFFMEVLSLSLALPVSNLENLVVQWDIPLVQMGIFTHDHITWVGEWNILSVLQHTKCIKPCFVD